MKVLASTRTSGNSRPINARTTSSNLPALDKHDQQSIIWLTLAVGAVCAIALWHGVTVFQEKTRFKPETIYSEAFSTPLNSISNLEGGSKFDSLYESWIHFKCPTGAVLRNSAEFQEKRSTEARLWFLDKRPNDKGLESPEYMTFRWRNFEDPSHLKNEWLLHNSGTSDYYYRTWGY